MLAMGAVGALIVVGLVVNSLLPSAEKLKLSMRPADGSTDGNGSVFDVWRDEKHRSRLAQSSLLADRQLQRPRNQHAPLLVGMRMHRHLGSVIHFQIREHQVLAERSSHSATGHWLDRLKLGNVDEAHFDLPLMPQQKIHQSDGIAGVGDDRICSDTQKSFAFPLVHLARAIVSLITGHGDREGRGCLG